MAAVPYSAAVSLPAVAQADPSAAPLSAAAASPSAVEAADPSAEAVAGPPAAAQAEDKNLINQNINCTYIILRNYLRRLLYERQLKKRRTYAHIKHGSRRQNQR